MHFRSYFNAWCGLVIRVSTKNFLPQVFVVQRRLTHYRVPLFEHLYAELELAGVNLRLVCGSPAPNEESKRDSGRLDWAELVDTRYRKMGGKYLCWQRLPSDVRAADLVIVPQENSLLSNYPLLLHRRAGGPRVAFWGHGANLQSGAPNGLRERFKRWTTRQVDWWFTYTQMSANLVRSAGFSQNRITVLNNAIDTSRLQSDWQSITRDQTQFLRESMGFAVGPIGVFVGSLYADKRLEFLFAAAEAIRRSVPGFQLLIVGEGPECGKVRDWCVINPWARWVGARFGKEKAEFLSTAQVMICPGAVGLGILDSFVCGVPIVTTDCGMHGPEIAYLENGFNGVITSDNLNDYVKTCVSLLSDSRALEALRVGCSACANQYTVENMARRFADGIAKALAVKGEL